MSLIMRKIGLGAFLSFICLDFFAVTDPIVQGDWGCVIPLVLGGNIVFHKPSRGNVFWGEQFGR